MAMKENEIREKAFDIAKGLQEICGEKITVLIQPEYQSNDPWLLGLRYRNNERTYEGPAFTIWRYFNVDDLISNIPRYVIKVRELQKTLTDIMYKDEWIEDKSDNPGDLT